MSLHALATDMASKGRNGDSMLVHMTPSEVHGLQALAMKHGGSLTVNPDTGLPEANFLKSLLPMLAGFALGPAGFGLVSSAMGAGALVGGITGIATGSLSKGLMAGLGAYGGFGIGESLAGLGAGELAQGQISANMPTLAEGASQTQIADYAKQVNDLRTAGLQGASQLPMADKLSAGFSSASASPMDALNFAKDNKMALGMAAAPIMADMMVPTTTKMPTNTNPAYIRQYVAGDRPQAPRALAPVLATDWGSRNFQDAYRGAEGGIVALADGGAVPGYAIGGEAKAALEAAYAANDVGKINEIARANMITAADVADTYKGFDTSGIKGLELYTPPSFGGSVAGMKADIAAGGDGTGNLGGGGGGGGGGAPAYTQYSDQQIGDWFAQNKNATDAQVKQAIIDSKIDPNAVNRYLAGLTGGFTDSTWDKGGSGTLGIYNQWNALGISPDEYYAAALANNPKYAGWTKEMLQKGYNLDKGAYALTDQIARDKIAADPKLGYDKQWVKFMDTNGYTVDDMAQAFGISKNEIRDRIQRVKDAEKKVTTGTGGTGISTLVGGPPTTTILPTNPQTNAPPGTTNPYGNVNNPGDLTFNNDGTVTVQPNLPGRPYGGYSGITELTNAYTAGGGSTGYVSPVVLSALEHDKTYNKQTDDSLDAYNYLIGKAGAKYPSKSRATEIMKPYEEAVLGYAADPTKKKFINVGGKMVKNPQYVEPKTLKQKNSEASTAAATAAKAGKAPTIDIVDSSGESTQTYTAVLQDDGTYAAGNGKRYDATGKELAAGGGMMGYALGGLGTLGGYSDGGRLLKGPGDGVSDSIPATIGAKQQPARLADGEFVVPARIVSELGNGSTDAGAKKLYAMMDRVQKARGKTTGKNKVAANSRADKYLPA